MKNPNAFQGTKRKNNYFEGWYLKHQKGDQMFSVIPAYHIDREGNAFSSLQVITKEHGIFHGRQRLSVVRNRSFMWSWTREEERVQQAFSLSGGFFSISMRKD